MSERTRLFQAYAQRFHEALAGGVEIEDVVKALADACKRAIEDETPSNTRARKKKIAFYSHCTVALDEAAQKIKEASR